MKELLLPQKFTFIGYGARSWYAAGRIVKWVGLALNIASGMMLVSLVSPAHAACVTTSVGNADTTNCVVGGPVTPAINTGAGVDSFTMTGGSLVSLDQGSGFDTFVMNGGHIIGLFTDGDDVTFTGGRIGSVNLGAGNNVFNMSGTAQIDGVLNAEQGNDTINLFGGSIGGIFSSGSGNDILTLDGTAMGSNVIFEGGSDQLILRSGSIAGSIFMDDGPGHTNGTDGSDTALVESSFNLGAFTGIFDGGDDFSSADGLIDVLTIRGASAAVNGANYINWETIIVDGGSLSFSPILSVGSDPGTGLSLLNGGILNAAGGFALTGNLSNNGVVSTLNGVVGDTFSMSGSYSGGGLLHVDVDFATDTADTLTVGGSVTGAGTAISVANVSSGASTGNNVLVVDVTGTTAAGDFTLAGGPVAAGAFNYDLSLLGSQWFLASIGANSVGSVYESAPFVLGTLVDLPSLEQRVSQRRYLTKVAGDRQIVHGAWLRAYGDRFDVTPSSSTSGASIDGSSGGLQFGYDALAEVGDNGQWVFGITGQYGTVNSTVTNAMGNGSIKGDGYGLGATATWYGQDGLFFDAQAQLNWLSGDYAANGTDLASDQDAMGYGLSVEMGKRLALHDTVSLIPQAQLIWSSIDGDSFTDGAGSAVDIGSRDSLIGRLGLAYEHEYLDTDGGPEKYYAIGNLVRDFSSASSVNVAGASLGANYNHTWAEIGLGGSKFWDDNKAIYGEVSYRESLSNNGRSGLGLTAGFSIQW